jgi:LuxR family maltose regulon positive regulatory protein
MGLESFGLVRAVADDWLLAAERLPALLSSRVARLGKVSNSFLERAARRCGLGVEARLSVRPTGKGASQLSDREMEVLIALASGRSNKEIARLLDVGAETVYWHLKDLFNKLGAANRRHAVDRARLLGIIE